MTTTDIIETTAVDTPPGAADPVADSKLMSGLRDLANEKERFDPSTLPATRAELAKLITKCLQTDDPASEGIPVAFHAALAGGIYEALVAFREMAVGADNDEFVAAIDALLPAFEIFV